MEEIFIFSSALKASHLSKLFKLPHVGKSISFYTISSGYVTKYFDVKNRAFLPNFMRNFDHLYAKLLSGYQSRNNRCENRAFY